MCETSRMKIWQIYLITSTVSGRRYIGLTCQGIDTRFKVHCRDAKKQTAQWALARAIRKYGGASFTVEAIASCTSIQDASATEIALIDQHRTLYPIGYNMTKGGEGMLACADVRKRMSEKAKLRVRAPDSDETRRRKSESRKAIMSDAIRARIGETHRGKVHSEETRKRISESKKGRKIKPHTRSAIEKRVASRLANKLAKLATIQQAQYSLELQDDRHV